METSNEIINLLYKFFEVGIFLFLSTADSSLQTLQVQKVCFY
jgi:hypothetical protein